MIDPKLDIMSYRGTRPVCAVCQLNHDAIFLAENGPSVLRRVLRELQQDRERLWPREGKPDSTSQEGHEAVEEP